MGTKKNNYGPRTHWGGRANSFGGSERPRHVPRIIQWRLQGPWGQRGTHPVFERLRRRPLDRQPARVQPLPLSFGQAKVADLGHQVLRNEDVAGSKVSMHQLLALQVLHALGHVPGEGEGHRDSSGQVNNSQGQASFYSVPWFPLDLGKFPPCPPRALLTGKTAEAVGCSQGPGPESVESSPGCPVAGGDMGLGFEAAWLPPQAPPAPQPHHTLITCSMTM